MRPNKLAKEILLAIAPIAYGSTAQQRDIKVVAKYAVDLATAFDAEINKPAKVSKAKA